MPMYRYEDLVAVAVARGVCGGETAPVNAEDGLCCALIVASTVSAEVADSVLGGTTLQVLYLPESAERAAYPYKSGQYVLSSWYNGGANDYRVMTSSGETTALFGWYTGTHGDKVPADVQALARNALWLAPPVPELAGKEVEPQEEEDEDE